MALKTLDKSLVFLNNYDVFLIIIVILLRVNREMSKKNVASLIAISC